MRKRCWNTVIGKKKRTLCNTDAISKRKTVQRDVYTQLDNCQDALIDSRLVRGVNPDVIQYGVQAGRVRNIQCARRKIRGRCRAVQIQNDHIQVCESDPLEKKIDIIDTVDSVLMGCNTARVVEPDGHSYIMRKRKTGLNPIQRQAIARDTADGKVTSVKCIQRVKRRD